MTMATISPSGREISPTGSSYRSSRLDLLKFRLVAAAKPRKSSPAAVYCLRSSTPLLVFVSRRLAAPRTLLAALAEARSGGRAGGWARLRLRQGSSLMCSVAKKLLA
ncbi:hypothetical protein ZWY2020_024777 [Hordeum vulgare]|nr:hypothetical protein ZWY2020_024777 [Hordeum vulgare]